MSGFGAIIPELEDAFQSGVAEKRIEMLRRVTDLFVSGANAYTEEHVALFDDVIGRLSRGIEARVLAELSSRLAPVANAPIGVIKALGSDDVIEVAGPVLIQSKRLRDDDLVQIINTKSQNHLLAISTREQIGHVVTDALVERGDRQVVRTVVRNSGARFSDAGFGVLVNRSQQDDILAESVGLRRDLPPDLFAKLFAEASDAVQQKLAAANPEQVGDIRRVLDGIAADAIGAAEEATRDYSEARVVVEALHASKALDESQVCDFARQKKFEETAVALEMLCGFPIYAVERVFLGEKPELILILAKSMGFSWETTKYIMRLRPDSGYWSDAKSETYQSHFEKLQAATAKRVIRFYKVRQTASEKPS
jgi:uncharacterized protein (DUF2336 family)